MRPHRLLLALLASLVLPAAACSSDRTEASPGPATTDAATDAPGDASLDDPPIDARYEAFAKAFDEERKKLGAPGAAVAILEHGEITFAHGFGTKGPNSGEKVRARTSFRIGSMTKVLTSVAVLQQAQAGKLDLGAKVTSVIPKLAIGGDELASLAIGDLLSQQSGLNDHLVVDAPTAQKTDAALATFLTGAGFRARTYFMNPPGLFWNYSNPNYYVAGLVAEVTSGVGYRELLATKLFQPLGMTRTFFLGSEVIADGDFTNGESQDRTGEPWDVAPDSYDNAWARPAGYAWSNVLDYARFVRFLHAGDPAVLSDALRAELQAKQIDTLQGAGAEHYGYGVFVHDGFHAGPGEYVATKLVSHGGDINGFAADFYLIPQTGFGIVALANADGAHFGSSLALAMKSFGELPAPSTAPDTAVDPSTFDAFVGEYSDPYNVGRVKITKDASGLAISMPDVDAAGVPYDSKLVPASPGTFVLGIQGTQILVTFVDDGASGSGGKATWLRTRPFVARRDVAAPAAKVVDADTLRVQLRALPKPPLVLP